MANSNNGLIIVAPECNDGIDLYTKITALREGNQGTRWLKEKSEHLCHYSVPKYIKIKK